MSRCGACRLPTAVLIAMVLVACLSRFAVSQSTDHIRWGRHALEDRSKTSDDCREAGKEAAVQAGNLSCTVLKERCANPPIIQDPPEVTLLKDLEGTCRKKAETACVAFARMLLEDEDCMDLLEGGPPEPVEGCERLVDAVIEFNWMVIEFCRNGS